MNLGLFYYDADDEEHICCEWRPVFEDIDSMHLNLGSEIRPVINTINDYNLAENRPSINGVELVGNKSNEELLISSMSNMDIENILNSFI